MEAERTTTDVPELLSEATSARDERTIFVAYAYGVFPKDDYRGAFASVQKAFDVKFVFADERIENVHILQKIGNMIRRARFSIFDITGWNPNVALELGMAYGWNERFYIAFNPVWEGDERVPSDIAGIDRIEYKSFGELEKGVARVVAQQFPPKIEKDPL